MSSYAVIRDVSETLQTLLDDNIEASSDIEISLNSPKSVAITTDHLLNLYLYHVTENPFAKNRDSLRHGTSVMQRTPLALNLYYMLTPYTQENNGGNNANLDEHLILGDAMRIFYDHPLITYPLLQGNLRGRGEEMRIILCRMNLEEQTRIWNSLQMPYRLSVCYEVRIALIDSRDIEEVGRVGTQITEYSELLR
ncbi:MAG: DUF4255 domain-containing protein [Deltaproteobacteria bacterium]|nr:DUF4255 domain-containing protein [Deltaproteobacteria bacterium]